MDNKSNLSGVGALVVSLVTTLIVLGLGMLFGGSKDTQITPEQQNAIEQRVADLLIPMLPKPGALASPALGPWYSVGDIVHDGNSSTSFVVSTSTVCAIQSPAATSTLTSAALLIVGEPYTNQWDIYKSPNIATKTTLLAHGNDAQNAFIVATTTLTALTDGVVPPNSYINFSVSTTTTVNANFAPNVVGRCSAQFREL